MSHNKSCPRCGSFDLTIERSINGNTHCNICKYSAPHSLVELDIRVYEKIKRLRKRMGLPVVCGGSETRNLWITSITEPLN